MRRVAVVLLALGCAPSTNAACHDLGAQWCQRLWLCVTEHSRANPDFVARYGGSPTECAALYATACEAAFTCSLNASRCAGHGSTCTELETARADCFSGCAAPP